MVAMGGLELNVYSIVLQIFIVYAETMLPTLLPTIQHCEIERAPLRETVANL